MSLKKLCFSKMKSYTEMGKKEKKVSETIGEKRELKSKELVFEKKPK